MTTGMPAFAAIRKISAHQIAVLLPSSTRRWSATESPGRPQISDSESPRRGGGRCSWPGPLRRARLQDPQVRPIQIAKKSRWSMRRLMLVVFAELKTSSQGLRSTSKLSAWKPSSITAEDMRHVPAKSSRKRRLPKQRFTQCRKPVPGDAVIPVVPSCRTRGSRTSLPNNISPRFTPRRRFTAAACAA